MTKFFKYGIYVLLAIMSISCSDDDNNDPDAPDTSVICGRWALDYPYNDSYVTHFMVIKPDGTFSAETGYILYGGGYRSISIRGTWKYKNGIMTISATVYQNNSFNGKYDIDYTIIYDTYINKLILSSQSSDQFNLNGQYNKTELN